MRIEKDLAVSVETIDTEGSIWDKAFKKRLKVQFAKGGEPLDLGEDFISCFAGERKINLCINADYHEDNYTIEDGVIYYNISKNLEKAPHVKRNVVFVLSPDVLVTMFHRKISGEKEFLEEKAKSFTYALENYLKGFESEGEEVRTDNNDLLINGKKVGAWELVVYENSLIYCSMGLTLEIEEEYLKESLKNDPNNKMSTKKVSSIKKELKNFNKTLEEFTDDFIEILKNSVFA